jgi:hypothetical protein
MKSHIVLHLAEKLGKIDHYRKRYKKCWKQAKAEKKGDFWKESMHEESDSWKEEQHACMQGRPNDGRVRVLVMDCNG